MLAGYGTCLLRAHTTPRGATVVDSACVHHTGSARWRYCFRTSAPKYETGTRIMLALTLFLGDSREVHLEDIILLPERVGRLLPSYGD